MEGMCSVCMCFACVLHVMHEFADVRHSRQSLILAGWLFWPRLKFALPGRVDDLSFKPSA